MMNITLHIVNNTLVFLDGDWDLMQINIVLSGSNNSRQDFRKDGSTTVCYYRNGTNERRIKFSEKILKCDFIVVFLNELALLCALCSSNDRYCFVIDDENGVDSQIIEHITLIRQNIKNLYTRTRVH